MSIFTQTDGKGLQVVLLHGWTHDHRSILPIKDFLADTCKVTMIDLPGAGQTDWNDNIQSINDCGDIILNSLPQEAIYLEERSYYFR